MKTFYATIRIDLNEDVEVEDVQDIIASVLNVNDPQGIVEEMTLCGLNEED